MKQTLTINEVAQSLDLPVSTVERWIRQGRIPIKKNGGAKYTFEQTVLEKWAQTANLTFSPPRDVSDTDSYPDVTAENVLQAMKRGGVHHHLVGDDKIGVIKSAVEHIPGLSENVKKILFDKLIERETMTSTGVGKGVAIPHPRSPLTGVIDVPIIATGFLAEPIDFNAIDHIPVFVMFFLICPNVKVHLHLLSRLAFCVRDPGFIEFLRTYPDEPSFFRKIGDFEARLKNECTL